MNPKTGSRWQTEFVDWFVKTMTIGSVIVTLTALGCAFWIIYHLISVGYEARFNSGTSVSTTKPTSGRTQQSVQESDTIESTDP